MEHPAADHPLPCSDFWAWVVSHCCGGTVLTLSGLWWAINVFTNYYAAAHPSGGQPFKSRMFYPGPIRALPLEGWFFLLVPGVLSIYLLIGGVLYSNMFGVLHVVFLLGFAMYGAVGLLMHHRVLLPEGLDAAMFVIAFYLKIFVTYTHLDGKFSTVAQAHLFLVLNEVFIIFATLMERFSRDSVVCALARPYLVLVDSSWLIYIGFRFPGCSQASLDLGHSHHHMDGIMVFTWLYLFHAVVILAIGWLVRRSKCVHYAVSYKVLEHEVS